MKSILLVENDESLNRGISFKLEKEEMSVFSAKSLMEAREIFNSMNIDLVILDIGLPDGSGLDFCREIRKISDVFIIFLTACDEEVDIVTGLDMGADDYITKPFSFMILMSKVNAFLRRSSENKSSEKIISGDISFCPQEMMVLKNGREIILSKKELQLLKYLMVNGSQIIKREQLLSELWDLDGDFVDSNTVAVNIRRLREKIEEDPSNPKYIRTVRGIGYVWAERCVK
ncbi:response regulator transcription factor [Clostridiaceae bacterium UIB06]|uniref:Response regulator transcription factor n=1 Tax=Clostridium thailandense TaxID=2794346 RepID=A0A949TLT3_9CLOT|nr:response regulator transcription factor [Clostridium thailandense]MBV7275229.1 response regulator transcription factor [Clostridium thailandense]MCH5137740.1 response regulator transcription factor [Clostridiaceae bacterium UIB06]